MLIVFDNVSPFLTCMNCPSHVLYLFNLSLVYSDTVCPDRLSDLLLS